MKPSEELRLGRSIIAALERVRLCVCKSGTAAHWHLEKAKTVARKPRLLERIAPHLEGQPAKDYLAALSGWIEQTQQQEAKCAEIWTKRRADYPAQRDHLVAMLLRYDFSLRSYEKLARQPSMLLVESSVSASSSDSEAAHDESATRQSAQEFAELQSQIERDLDLIDKARAELVIGNDDLVVKLAQKSIEKSAEPLEEAMTYARSGLAKAAENYDVRQGHRFSTYAQWWIKTAIKEKKSWEK